MTVDTKKIRRNGGIRAQQVRLIDADGSQVGVVSLFEGLKKAEEQELDLVEISPNVNPPVCKILDFGKYSYALEKKEKDNKKKHKNVEVKEIKFTSKIEEHDYQTKLRRSEKFLKRGNMLKVTMQFRGRERAHIDIGQKILDRFFNDIADIASVERNYGLRGGSIVVTVSPKQ